MSEVTDVRKIEIFKDKIKAKPTTEELEAMLMDCATCPSKALGVMAAGAIQNIFLDPDYEGDRLAIISGEAFNLLSNVLNPTLDAFNKHMRKPEDKNKYDEAIAATRAKYAEKSRQEHIAILDEMDAIAASDTTPERYEPRG